MNPEFSRQIKKKKFSDIGFHKNPWSGNRIDTDGRTDRQTRDEDNSFHNFAKALKKRQLSFEIRAKI